MEGVLMRLGVHASLLNEELTIELARYSLKDWLDDSAKTTNFEQHSHGKSTVTIENKILQHICIMFQILKKDFIHIVVTENTSKQDRQPYFC